MRLLTFYDITKARHSVRAASRFSFKLVRLPPPSSQKKEKHTQPPRSGRLAWFLTGGLSQPFPIDIHPEPSLVMSLISEALGLRCHVLGLISGNAIFMHVDGHSFLKCFDVRDENKICGGGSAHELPSHSLLRFGSLIPSTISRFCASLIPAE